LGPKGVLIHYNIIKKKKEELRMKRRTSAGGGCPEWEVEPK
jgi:hypothetical protein